MAEHQSSLSKSFPIKPKLKAKARSQSQSLKSKYWSSFKIIQIPKLISSIPSLSFSPSSPHLFAATHSAPLTLFSTFTFCPSSSISSFSDVVSCFSFLSDGSLIADSDVLGLIQVFDVKTRTPLRRLRSHTCLVRFVKYPLLDKLHVVSGGDDAIVKYLDVSRESVVDTNGTTSTLMNNIRA